MSARCTARRILQGLLAAIALAASPVAGRAQESGESAWRRAIRARDFERAAALAREAALAGDPRAAFELAGLHRAGRGVARDVTAAERWLRQAADAGLPEARFALACAILARPHGEAEREVARGLLEAARADGFAPAEARLASLREGDRQADPELALRRAVLAGSPGGVRAALEGGADPLAVELDGAPALLAAARRADPGPLRVLLEWLGSRAPAPLLADALREAARAGRTDAVAALLEAGADPDATDAEGRSALLVAAWHGRARVVELLLAAGADAAARDHHGRSAAELARRAGMSGLARRLRGAGSPPASTPAEPSRPEPAFLLARPDPDQGWPALSVAALRGDLPAVDALLRAGAPVDAVDAGGWTPLARAAAAGHTAVVARLLEAGADPGAGGGKAGGDAAIPAELAARGGHAGALALLLGAAPSAGASSPALLRAAAASGSVPTLEAVLAGGSARPGPEALEAAIDSGNPGVVARLLEAGADPNRPGPLGPPLCLAAARGRSHLVGLLLRAGSAPDVACSEGRSPLALAASRGDVGSVRELLAAGARVSGRPGEVPPIVAAAAQGSAGCVRLLLDGGADPEARGPTRETPLLRAAEAGHEEVVRLLLAAGARPGRRDAAGRDAVELARRGGHAGLADRLARARGARLGGLF